jgi:hypothetical protein
MREDIARALRIIRQHPNVAAVRRRESDRGFVVVDIELALGLPGVWLAAGGSPNGVRSVETTIWSFLESYPLQAPRIHLRQDFDRSFPHINPGRAGSLPHPCIVDGNINEFLQQEGIPGLLNALVEWLEKAALDRLIDPQQGWEPARRDNLDDVLVGRLDHLRDFVGRTAGAAILEFSFRSIQEEGATSFLFGELGHEPVPVSPTNAVNLFRFQRSHTAENLTLGKSIAIIVWPGKLPNGQPQISESYHPDSVSNLGELLVAAESYGCGAALRSKLEWIRNCVKNKSTKHIMPTAVLLCVRRPFHLIQSTSNIELLAYVIENEPPAFIAGAGEAPVRIAALREGIARPLLIRLATGKDPGPAPSWTLLGGGSLGSKIGLHLARAGHAPKIVIDCGYLSPHNAARHGLVPEKVGSALHWMGAKAEAMIAAIGGLGQQAEAADRDVVAVLANAAERKRLLPKGAWAAVNTTASLVVREALGADQRTPSLPPIVETTLFGHGMVAVMTVESGSRNPNTLDLIAEAYTTIAADASLRAVVFAERPAVGRQIVGEGCGTSTIVMSDAQISMLAAPMAEELRRMQAEPISQDAGRTLIGQVAQNGLDLRWTSATVPPAAVVTMDGRPEWTVRISRRVVAMMDTDIAQHPRIETGGIIMGRFSEVARAFYVTDLLPAPPDSTRSAGEFLLGTMGARKAIADYSERAAYTLFCLGTWHNHLGDFGPSNLDRQTAGTIALARLAPSVVLIRTPSGFRALFAEAPATEKTS